MSSLISKVDYLIIGQGLAGSILSWTLQQHKQSFLIIDNHYQNAASQVGAGLINYISGKRLTLTWEAQTLIPFAKKFYTTIETQLNTSFFKPLTEIRFLMTPEEENYAKKRLKDPKFKPYLSTITSNPTSPFKQVTINQSSILNIPQFLNALHHNFTKNNQLIQSQMNWSQLCQTNQGIEYHYKNKKIKAKNLILCVGSKLTETPWFSNIHYRLAKGETITIKIPQNQSTQIYNFGKWLIPFNNHWRLGATYEWNELNHTPTLKGKKELLDNLNKAHFLSSQITDTDIINHQAAIRCIVPDNAPIIGTHPHYKHIHVLGGLGSKGVMIAPYYAQQLVNHLLKKDPLPPHVDCKRLIETIKSN
mgnify:FL=1